MDLRSLDAATRSGAKLLEAGDRSVSPLVTGQTGQTGQTAPSGRLFDPRTSLEKTPVVGQRRTRAPALLEVHRTPLKALKVEPSPKLDPLRRAFDNLAPKTTRANLRLLPKNRDAWLGLWNVIDTAPDGVDASYFILERDIFGMALLGGLLSKAQQGHRVRLLVDSAGDYLRMKGFTLPTRGGDYLQELVAHGAEVRIYNPMHKKIWRSLLGKARGLGRLANNHDKLVRSRIMAQTGGRNVAKDYLGEASDLEERVYRDTCVLIEGEGTSKELERAFEREFYQDEVTFKQFPDLFGNWRKRDGELLGAYYMMDAWVKGELGLSKKDLARLQADASFRNATRDRVVEQVSQRLPRSPGWLTRRSLKKRAGELMSHVALYGQYPAFAAEKTGHQDVEVKVLDRTSAAAAKHDHLTGAIRTAAASATRRIRIHTPYLTLSEDAIRALEIAARRGVEIELLTNSPASTDSTFTQALFLEDWPRLLARIPTLRIFTLSGDQKLHAKSIQVDDRMTFVVSYNMDILSECVNSELGIVAWSPAFAKEAANAFYGDLADPKNLVREYRIAKDAGGQALLDERGEPIVTYGPRDHIDPKKWRRYKGYRWLIRQARKLPVFANHQRPRLRATNVRTISRPHS